MNCEPKQHNQTQYDMKINKQTNKRNGRMNERTRPADQLNKEKTPKCNNNIK